MLTKSKTLIIGYILIISGLVSVITAIVIIIQIEFLITLDKTLNSLIQLGTTHSSTADGKSVSNLEA
jgi:hypothetical protein